MHQCMNWTWYMCVQLSWEAISANSCAWENPFTLICHSALSHSFNVWFYSFYVCLCTCNMYSLLHMLLSLITTLVLVFFHRLSLLRHFSLLFLPLNGKCSIHATADVCTVLVCLYVFNSSSWTCSIDSDTAHGRSLPELNPTSRLSWRTFFQHTERRPHQTCVAKPTHRT